MKKSVCVFFLLAFAQIINSQNRNAIINEVVEIYFNVISPVDSVITKEFISSDNNSLELEFTYINTFEKNGILRSFAKTYNENNEKITALMTEGFESINHFVYSYLYPDAIWRFRLNKKEGNIEYWDVYEKFSAPLNFQVQRGNIKLTNHTDFVELDIIDEKKEAYVYKSFNERGELLDFEMKTLNKDNILDCILQKSVYNENYTSMKRDLYTYKEDPKSGKRLDEVHAYCSLFEFKGIDTKGNWTECIVKDDAGSILQKYTREIFYPQN